MIGSFKKKDESLSIDMFSWIIRFLFVFSRYVEIDKDTDIIEWEETKVLKWSLKDRKKKMPELTISDKALQKIMKRVYTKERTINNVFWNHEMPFFEKGSFFVVANGITYRNDLFLYGDKFVYFGYASSGEKEDPDCVIWGDLNDIDVIDLRLSKDTKKYFKEDISSVTEGMIANCFHIINLCLYLPTLLSKHRVVTERGINLDKVANKNVVKATHIQKAKNNNIAISLNKLLGDDKLYVTGEPRMVERTYTRHLTNGWEVRGFVRHLKSGKEVYIRPHTRGTGGHNKEVEKKKYLIS